MILDHKTALVTGGKRIGAVVARELAARGVDVAFSYSRSKSEAEQAAATVRSVGPRAAVFQADLSLPDAPKALVDQVVAEFGRLDILINMASVYVHRPFPDLTVADWDAVVDVDLRAAFLCAHAAVPHMKANGGGRIIMFSDWVARSRRPRYTGYVPYYVAKAGASALAEALALELAPDDILVNAIAPGPIVAPPGTTDEEARAAGHDRRGSARRRTGDAARTVGRRDRDREGGARARRERLHHRRDHSRRRRTTPEMNG